jgi:hypothetical protein
MEESLAPADLDPNDESSPKDSSKQSATEGILDPASYIAGMSKRKRFGRSARKRRKKYLEVQAAIEASSSGNYNIKTDLKVPDQWKDRQYTRPSIAALRDISEEDEKNVLHQLGYLPGNLLKVAARTSKIPGFEEATSSPIVLQLYPLVTRDATDPSAPKPKHKKKRLRKLNASVQEDIHCEESPTKTPHDDDNDSRPDAAKQQLWEPFPTMFWISHPHIRALISKLELDQAGKRFEKHLLECPEDLERMARAHLSYGKQRRALITDRDWEWIQRQKWESAFDTSRGVAGMKGPPHSIKCLHAHAAHYWSGCEDNCVGKWVAEYVERQLQGKNDSKSSPGHQ